MSLRQTFSKTIIIQISISVTVADKGYDSEDNHVLVREYVHALSIIPPRYQSVLLWRTYGIYRKQMKKRGYSRTLYNQRNNKNETIMSVIKRLFGECLISRLTRTQNRATVIRDRYRLQHAPRLTNLVIITMISTEP